MAEPFKATPLEGASFIGGLIRRRPRRNGLIAVRNLLAEADSIEDVSVRDAEAAAAFWGLKLGSRFRDERLELASDFLNHCLADRRLDDVELDRLRHLRRILRLRKDDVNEIKSRAVKAVYAESVDDVLIDHYLDDEEREFLDRMAANFELPGNVAERIYVTKAQEIVQGVLDEAIQDERLSPDEDAELAALAANLGVSIAEDDETRRVLDRFRTYWQLEEGTLPRIDADINLQKGEVCHLKTEADWLEHRTVTRSVAYGGPTVRLKIVEGVYWRAGNMSFAPTTEDVMKRLDSGTCYLTNRRLLFRGEHGNKTIPFSRILAVETYSNGVQVEKDRGKTPFLAFKHGTDVFGLMLDRLIDETA